MGAPVILEVKLMPVMQAFLKNGQKIEYLSDSIGDGGMKVVYFTTDKKSVVSFYKDIGNTTDHSRLQRLSAITGLYNPISDNNEEYWGNLFCWPTGIITQPGLGILMPVIPSNYFFASGQFKGREKNGKWFTSPKLRAMLPSVDVGDWMRYLHICIRLTRIVRRMHHFGLAHADLTNRNILVDPSAGKAIIIFDDDIIIPGIPPPDILQTPGYSAPEVVATQEMPFGDPKRISPSMRTNLHALSVLIYELLLQRHPLRGPKVNSIKSSEEDERLSMGSKALFIENPTDTSNRPPKVAVPYNILGPYLKTLVEQSFIDALHNPDERPVARVWELALLKTVDLLMPCGDNKCTAKWFVLPDKEPVCCPFCGWTYRGTFPVLHFYSQRQSGKYVIDNYRLVVYGTQYFHQWHAFECFADENADRTPLGYFAYHNGL